MGLTSHLADAYNTFSSTCFPFSSLLIPMKMSLMSLTMKVQGPGSHPVYVFFIFSENSVGRVSSSKSVGSVTSSESVSCVSISRSVDRFSGIFSVGCVRGILKVGRIGELI